MATPLTIEQSPSSIIHTLHPGDVMCCERDEKLETLLGSCVAIILTDRRRTIGAMCHIIHCKPALGIVEKPSAYADVAISSMYQLLSNRGFNPTLCDAYVYGGGNMFPELFKHSHVGSNNGSWVLKRLAQDGVHVLLNDLGGNTYRRLSWTVGPELPNVIAMSV